MEWSPQIPHMPGAQQPLAHSLILGVQKRLKVWRMRNKAICAGCRYEVYGVGGYFGLYKYKHGWYFTLWSGLGVEIRVNGATTFIIIISDRRYLTELPESIIFGFGTVSS